MRSLFLQKTKYYIPLWRRTIPPYPWHWTGGPQLRIFMPLFWMKMIKPQKRFPPEYVNFEIHPQMTRYDVKQYLEKIYKVSVISVRTATKTGEKQHHPVSRYPIERGPERKFAFVQLRDEEFEFLDLFGDSTPEDKDMELMKSQEERAEKTALKDSRTQLASDIPAWFR